MNVVRKLSVLAATLAAATLGAGGMVLSAGTASAHASVLPAVASAPVASAGAHSGAAIGCGEPPGPYHLETNANRTLGLTYHGVGNQVNVTPSIGDTTLQCAIPPDIYVLHNNAGNCVRITDASNDYKVIEQSGCILDNANYEWELFPVANGVQFENIHFPNEWLGTEHCDPGNGDGIEGVPNQAGQCVTWILGAR
jgi:hypothetical protein